MAELVGTSGYGHAEWKGIFYPVTLSAKKMLGFYAGHFPVVEINYTFRRLPTPKILESWAAQVPESFRFALKAPQLITHVRRLQNAEKEVSDFLDIAGTLRKRLGPILFQLPPTFKRDVSRLRSFLAPLVGRARLAFEFRHASWFDDEAFDCLRDHAAAMCVADGDDLPQTDLVRTADWGYLRLRDDSYSDAQLRHWIRRIRAQKWQETYVFFMHEDTGIGPKLAQRFMELAGLNKS